MNPLMRAMQLVLLMGVTGCVSNSGKFDLSPCAGCDFQPVNSPATLAQHLEIGSLWHC